MSEFNYDKSVSNAHFENAGWQVSEFNHSNPFECHMVYIRDFRINHTQVFAIRVEDFSTMQKYENANVMAKILGNLMLKSHKGNLKLSQYGVFALAIGSYIKLTKTFAQWLAEKDPGERLHFVINIYGDKKQALRPFVLRLDETVLDAKTVLENTAMVARMDKEKHPEWFIKGMVH